MGSPLKTIALCCTHPEPIAQTSSETSLVKGKDQIHAAYVLIILRVICICSSRFLSATHNDSGGK